jgi:hypothetical protein
MIGKSQLIKKKEAFIYLFFLREREKGWEQTFSYVPLD